MEFCTREVTILGGEIMNANLEDARKALQAELDYAQQGVKHWKGKVSEIKKLIKGLGHLNQGEKSPTPAPRKAKVKTPIEASARTAKADIPSTAGDFWLNQFEEKPLTTQQLLKKAAKALNVELEGECKKRLGSRLATAIQKLAKEGGKISIHGEGRLRSYSRIQSGK